MAAIIENYVSFELAKLLKEKGFNEQTDCSYIIDNTDRPMVKIGDFVYNSNNESHRIAAPTLQMAMKWFREVHNIIITMDYDEYELEKINKKQVGYGWNIQKIENPTKYLKISEHVFDTYEESCKDAIKYCLTNLI